jgi:hypothetical protein
LIQRIATCYWRLARVLRFETGETRKSLDNVAVTHSPKKVDQANRSITQVQLWEYERRCATNIAGEDVSIQERFRTLEQLQGALRTSPMGTRYLMSALSVTRGEIQEKGSLSDESVEGLMYTFGYCDRALMDICIPLMRDKNDQKGRASV